MHVAISWLGIGKHGKIRGWSMRTLTRPLRPQNLHLISTPPCTRDFPRGVKIQISEGVVNRISEGQKRKSGKFPRVYGSREFLRVKKRKRWKIRRFTRISESQEEKKMENSEG